MNNINFKIGDHLIAIKSNHSCGITINIGDRLIISYMNDLYVSSDDRIYYDKGHYELDIAWYRKQKLKKIQTNLKNKDIFKKHQNL